jgi:hypothetical protein
MSEDDVLFGYGLQLFQYAVDCRPVATMWLHYGSALCCLCWLPFSKTRPLTARR